MKGFAALLVFVVVVAEARQKSSLVWMCLERCNDNAADGLAQIAANRNLLTSVSYEAYDLGPGGTLVDNGFTDVGPALAKLGLHRFAMITAANNTLLTQLLWGSDTPPIIADAVKVALQKNLTGFDIDFEPNDAMTDRDAERYVVFLNSFATSLHAAGKRLSVDVASWNGFWNFTRIATSRVDTVHQMDTYCCNDNFTAWKEHVERSAISFSAHTLSVGLIDEAPLLSQSLLAERLRFLSQKGLHQVAYWKIPMPQAYWNAMSTWMNI